MKEEVESLEERRERRSGKPGVVYLVGAGPGDPGLLTVRAARLLRRAGVVIHDALVGPAILDSIPAGTVLLDVGKRCGGRHTPQSEINRLLIQAARSHRVVVRLKGGDPFIFGRGGEEAQALHDAGVPFRVVPGITAASGVSAYAGIPLTHRGLASSVTFLTGHEDGSGTGQGIDWEAVARLDGTLAVYMGLGGLSTIAEKLIASGRAPRTPAAVVAWGTHARQRTVTAPLHEIGAAAGAAALSAPALVIIGPVAALGEELAWFDRLPLRGTRILVGRSRAQPSKLARSLQALGAEVEEFPRLQAVPLADSAEADTALRGVAAYRWLLFTSPAAVEQLWSRASDLGLDARAFAGCRIASLGQATTTALRKRGLTPEVALRTFQPELVLEALLRFGAIEEQAILFPRAEDADSPIAGRLGRAGARVDEVTLFRIVECSGASTGSSEGAAPFDLTILPSSSTAHRLAAMPALRAASGAVLAIGPESARAAEAGGLMVRRTLTRHSFSEVMRATLDLVRAEGSGVEHPVRWSHPDRGELHAIGARVRSGPLLRAAS